MHSQATTYARLAESPAIKNGLSTSCTAVEKTDNESQLIVLPISAEDTGMLSNRGGNDLLCYIVGFHLHDCLMFLLSVVLMILQVYVSVSISLIYMLQLLNFILLLCIKASSLYMLLAEVLI